MRGPSLRDLEELVGYAQRAKRQKCSWQLPRCIGRAVHDSRGCTCPAGMRDHDPRDVVQAWGRGYKSVGHYLADCERRDLLPFTRRADEAQDARPSAPVVPLRSR